MPWINRIERKETVEGRKERRGKYKYKGGGEREEKRREKKTISGQDGGMELNHKL